MQESVLHLKTYAFAVRAVKAYKFLTKEKKEFILSKQFLRSATSIGANSEEAKGAQSEKDFITKLSIAYKEARESKYWINLLRDTDYFTIEQATSLLTDLEEILKILGAIQKTLKNKRNGK